MWDSSMGIAGTEVAKEASDIILVDGSVLQRWRSVQCLFGVAGCGPHRARGRVRDRMSAAAGGAVLRTAEIAGQN